MNTKSDASTTECISRPSFSAQPSLRHLHDLWVVLLFWTVFHKLFFFFFEVGKNNKTSTSTINAPQTKVWDSAVILSNNVQEFEKQLEASQIKRNPWIFCDVFEPAEVTAKHVAIITQSPSSKWQDWVECHCAEQNITGGGKKEKKQAVKNSTFCCEISKNPLCFTEAALCTIL